MKVLNQYIVEYNNSLSNLFEAETSDPAAPKFFISYTKWTRNGWLQQFEEITPAAAADLITPPET